MKQQFMKYLKESRVTASQIKRNLTYVGIVNNTVVIKNNFNEIIFINNNDIDEVVESLLKAKIMLSKVCETLKGETNE